jgi:fatty acid amide hydrolase 2
MLLIVIFIFVALLLLLWFSRRNNLDHQTDQLGILIRQCDPLLGLSGSQIGEKIKKGTLTSEKIVRICIEQIEKVNPYINALVVDRFDQAIQEARKIDFMISELRFQGKLDEIEKLPRFFGVPCTVKECFQVKGMPNSAGLCSRKDFIAKQDCPVVEKLKQAGIIILGVTNQSELCLWMESNNNVYGRTKNPFDLSRTSGGSSGGEATIISSCGVPFGIGSDVGGSIRIPCFFNGVFGHKPTGGYVTNVGTHPDTEGLITRYCQLGPICRYSEDLYPLLEIISGNHPKEEFMQFRPLKSPKLDLSNLKIFSIDSSGSFLLSLPVHKELRLVQERVLRSLEEELGITVERVKIPELASAFFIWSSNMSLESKTSFHDLLKNEKTGRKPFIPLEIIRLMFGKSEFTLPALILSFLEKLLYNERLYLKYRALGEKLQSKLDEMLHQGILLFPSHPIPAPKHNIPLLIPFNFHYTGIFNVLELPATQVPLGLNSQGLPFGIQVISARHNDHLTIAASHILEKLFGGWKYPNSKTKT